MSEAQSQLHVETAVLLLLLKRTKIRPYSIINVNEKWVLYNNIWHKRSWCRLVITQNQKLGLGLNRNGDAVIVIDQEGRVAVLPANNKHQHYCVAVLPTITPSVGSNLTQAPEPGSHLFPLPKR